MRRNRRGKSSKREADCDTKLYVRKRLRAQDKGGASIQRGREEKLYAECQTKKEKGVSLI